MAEHWEILTARAATQVLGTGDTEDVVEFWIRSLPSGVVWPYRVPDVFNTSDRVEIFAEGGSTVINTVWAYPNVIAMAHAQSVDAAGALYDTMEVYVASDNGLLSERIMFPLRLFVYPVNNLTVGGGGGGGSTLPGATAPPLVDPPPWPVDWPSINEPIQAVAGRLNAMAAL